MQGTFLSVTRQTSSAKKTAKAGAAKKAAPKKAAPKKAVTKKAVTKKASRKAAAPQVEVDLSIEEELLPGEPGPTDDDDLGFSEDYEGVLDEIDDEVYTLDDDEVAALADEASAEQPDSEDSEENSGPENPSEDALENSDPENTESFEALRDRELRENAVNDTAFALRKIVGKDEVVADSDVRPRSDGEFLCQGCFLIVRLDNQAEPGFCRDCV